MSYKKVPSFVSFYDNLNDKILYDGQTFNQMYMTSLLQLMINGGWKIVPAHVNHGWLVDTVEDLRPYERLSKEGKLNKLWRVNAKINEGLTALNAVINYNFLPEERRRLTFYSECESYWPHP